MTAADASLAMTASTLGVWPVLFDVLVLLTMAMLLGNLAARLGQSVIVGYLIAGTVVGPNVLGWISSHAQLLNIAEIGVALLLFAIGLEFSPQRLRDLGSSALRVGPAQVVLTTLLAYAAGVTAGLDSREALIIGMMVSMSSTACVLRLLTDRAEVDTRHAKSALGVLLAQDAAVVPMILLVSVMATGGTAAQVASKLLLALLAAAGLLGVFYFLFNVVAPRMFHLPTYRKNRDLPVLLAVVMATGSAWATHAVGLSPALGSFAAGILLATSPFAIQIRADTRPLATLMVTLFFAAIGLFGDPLWVLRNWMLVTGVVLVIVIGKPAIIAVLARLFGQPWRYGVAAALCLAQVGEFSFVLATIAQSDLTGAALIAPLTFRTMVSATIVTLLLTPYLVSVAPRAGVMFESALAWSVRALRREGSGDGNDVGAGHALPAAPQQRTGAATSADAGPILIVGFGPVGRRVAEGLLDSSRDRLVAIDLNVETLKSAEGYGLKAQLGDATQRDILDHAGVNAAQVVVITVRDHVTTRHIIHLVRDLSPDAVIVARCLHHVHFIELLYTGAHEVVDEEDQVGGRLAEHVSKLVEGEGT